MVLLKPENLSSLTKERKQAILKRSMEDISSVYLEVRDIVLDIQNRGDAVSIEHYKKLKSDIATTDLMVTKDEVDRAYGAVDSKVIDALKAAAKNIEKFHKAQLERDMWSTEIIDGIIAGRFI